MSYWSKLSMKDRADVMKLFLDKGISDLDTMRREYNIFASGGDTNPGMTGMMKSKLATAAHFGNPTARRMTNYDARSYIWPGEYDYDNGIGELKRGNVFVGSYDNLVTPQIQDDGKGLIFVDDVWSPENDQRSYMQSLKFSNEKDARYFGDHYKEIAPMMNLYSNGGKIHIKPSHRGRLTELKKRTDKSEAELYKTGGPAVRKMITFARNARKWKHGLGGNLFEIGGDKNSYDAPQTFAGRVAHVAGASPRTVRDADVVSSVLQMTPYGYTTAALDLGRDMNRVYHGEEGAWKDAELDILGMIPGVSKLGMKKINPKTWIGKMKQGYDELLQPVREGVNSAINVLKALDFTDDTWGANKTSDAKQTRRRKY